MWCIRKYLSLIILMSSSGFDVISAQVSPLVVRRPEVLVGVDSPDDCAVVRAAPNSNLLGVFSVDFFRSFYEDPYIFGQVWCKKEHVFSFCIHAISLFLVSK